ncbi:hypothetical protein D9M71_555930 [compost metagenome]
MDIQEVEAHLLDAGRRRWLAGGGDQRPVRLVVRNLLQAVVPVEVAVLDLLDAGQAHAAGAVDQIGRLGSFGERQLVLDVGVPHGLVAVLRNRERNLRMCTFQTGSITYELGILHAFDGVVVHPLRIAGRPVGRIHIDAEGVRIALEQFQRAFVQLVLVLRQVGRSDAIERLFASKRVGIGRTALGTHDRLVISWRRAQAAIPGGNGAIGITGLDRAQGRQGIAELADFFIRGGCKSLAGEQYASGTHYQHFLVVH